MAPTAAASGASGGVNEARVALRAGRFGEAAATFASQLRQGAKGSATIQILVACSDDTVQKALQAVPDEALYIVPVSYKGRQCYRMCWGMYMSEARAASALQSLPGYFRHGGASPKVVPVSTVLP